MSTDELQVPRWWTDLLDRGGHAPTYLYRIVADHYRVEDINLAQ